MSFNLFTGKSSAYRNGQNSEIAFSMQAFISHFIMFALTLGTIVATAQPFDAVKRLNVAYFAAQPCIRTLEFKWIRHRWNSLEALRKRICPVSLLEALGSVWHQNFCSSTNTYFFTIFFFSSPKSKRDPILLPSYSYNIVYIDIVQLMINFAYNEEN